MPPRRNLFSSLSFFLRMPFRGAKERALADYAQEGKAAEFIPGSDHHHHHPHVTWKIRPDKGPETRLSETSRGRTVSEGDLRSSIGSGHFQLPPRFGSAGARGFQENFLNKVLPTRSYKIPRRRACRKNSLPRFGDPVRGCRTDDHTTSVTLHGGNDHGVNKPKI